MRAAIAVLLALSSASLGSASRFSKKIDFDKLEEEYLDGDDESRELWGDRRTVKPACCSDDPPSCVDSQSWSVARRPLRARRGGTAGERKFTGVRARERPETCPPPRDQVLQEAAQALRLHQEPRADAVLLRQAQVHGRERRPGHGRVPKNVQHLRRDVRHRRRRRRGALARVAGRPF